MKKILCLFAFSTLFLSSCSSSDSSNSPASVPLVKTMVIINADPAENNFNLLFTYSGNKLVNVKDSGVLIEEYIYTGDKFEIFIMRKDGMTTRTEELRKD